VNGYTVLKAIRDGAINATVAQNPFGHGYLSCALLDLLHQGWTPRQDYAFINAGIVVVMRANLDTYAAEIQQATQRIAAELKTRHLVPPK
jgi:ribose transport system substrate-binding protein